MHETLQKKMFEPSRDHGIAISWSMNSYNFMKTKKKIVREMMVWDTVYDDDDDDDDNTYHL